MARGSKREEILAAAREVFVREGYATASMDRIAEVAGASKRTVYNYFPSKEELFHEVVEQGMVEVFALEQVSYDPSRSLQSQLEQFADAKRMSTESLGMMKVIAGMLISDPELVKTVASRAQDKDDSLVRWLQAATEDGRMCVEDPRLAAEVFWAMTSGAFFWPAVFGLLPAARSLRMELVQVFLARYANEAAGETCRISRRSKPD
jgi:TetR/AcrR family transcriptional regulator of autoinduction and epiphytic fitness